MPQQFTGIQALVQSYDEKAIDQALRSLASRFSKSADEINDELNKIGIDKDAIDDIVNQLKALPEEVRKKTQGISFDFLSDLINADGAEDKINEAFKMFSTKIEAFNDLKTRINNDELLVKVDFKDLDVLIEKEKELLAVRKELENYQRGKSRNKKDINADISRIESEVSSGISNLKVPTAQAGVGVDFDSRSLDEVNQKIKSTEEALRSAREEAEKYSVSLDELKKKVQTAYNTGANKDTEKKITAFRDAVQNYIKAGGSQKDLSENVLSWYNLSKESYPKNFIPLNQITTESEQAQQKIRELEKVLEDLYKQRDELSKGTGFGSGSGSDDGTGLGISKEDADALLSIIKEIRDTLNQFRDNQPIMDSDEINTLKQKISELDTQISDIQTKLKTIDGESFNGTTTDVNTLLEKLTEVYNQITAVQDKLQGLDNDVFSGIKNDIASLLEKFEKMNNQLEEFINLSSKVKIPQTETKQNTNNENNNMAASPSGANSEAAIDGQNKLQKELKETDEIVQKIVYHWGELDTEKLGKTKSETFSKMISSFIAGMNDSGEPWGAFGTGTYVTSDPKYFQDVDTSTKPFAKFNEVDVSKLKMYETKTTENAKAVFDFLNTLQQYCVSFASGYNYQGTFDVDQFDNQKLFDAFHKVFTESRLTFDEFNKFIEDMFDLVEQAGIKADGSMSPRANITVGKDNIATRFMKMLGYQGINNAGTELDSLQHGSVIFDIDKSNIINKYKTLNEVLEVTKNRVKEIGTESSEATDKLENLGETNTKPDKKDTTSTSENAPQVDSSSIASEQQALEKLQQAINAVTIAIAEKNNAIQFEEIQMDSSVNAEIAKLKELEDKLSEIKVKFEEGISNKLSNDNENSNNTENIPTEVILTPKLSKTFKQDADDLLKDIALEKEVTLKAEKVEVNDNGVEEKPDVKVSVDNNKNNSPDEQLSQQKEIKKSQEEQISNSKKIQAELDEIKRKNKEIKESIKDMEAEQAKYMSLLDKAQQIEAFNNAVQNVGFNEGINTPEDFVNFDYLDKAKQKLQETGDLYENLTKAAVYYHQYLQNGGTDKILNREGKDVSEQLESIYSTMSSLSNKNTGQIQIKNIVDTVKDYADRLKAAKEELANSNKLIRKKNEELKKTLELERNIGKEKKKQNQGQTNTSNSGKKLNKDEFIKLSMEYQKNKKSDTPNVLEDQDKQPSANVNLVPTLDKNKFKSDAESLLSHVNIEKEVTLKSGELDTTDNNLDDTIEDKKSQLSGLLKEYHELSKNIQKNEKGEFYKSLPIFNGLDDSKKSFKEQLASALNAYKQFSKALKDGVISINQDSPLAEDYGTGTFKVDNAGIDKVKKEIVSLMLQLDELGIKYDDLFDKTRTKEIMPTYNKAVESMKEYTDENERIQAANQETENSIKSVKDQIKSLLNLLNSKISNPTGLIETLRLINSVDTNNLVVDTRTDFDNVAEELLSINKSRFKKTENIKNVDVALVPNLDSKKFKSDAEELLSHVTIEKEVTLKAEQVDVSEANVSNTNSQNIDTSSIQDLLSKSFDTEGKKAATTQLKETYNEFSKFYNDQEALATQEGAEAAYKYYMSYKEALNKGVADKTLNTYSFSDSKYDTSDIDKLINESRNKLESLLNETKPSSIKLSPEINQSEWINAVNDIIRLIGTKQIKIVPNTTGQEWKDFKTFINDISEKVINLNIDTNINNSNQPQKENNQQTQNTESNNNSSSSSDSNDNKDFKNKDSTYDDAEMKRQADEIKKATDVLIENLKKQGRIITDYTEMFDSHQNLVETRFKEIGYDDDGTFKSSVWNTHYNKAGQQTYSAHADNYNYSKEDQTNVNILLERQRNLYAEIRDIRSQILSLERMNTGDEETNKTIQNTIILLKEQRNKLIENYDANEKVLSQFEAYVDNNKELNKLQNIRTRTDEKDSVQAYKDLFDAQEQYRKNEEKIVQNESKGIDNTALLEKRASLLERISNIQKQISAEQLTNPTKDAEFSINEKQIKENIELLRSQIDAQNELREAQKQLDKEEKASRDAQVKLAKQFMSEDESDRLNKQTQAYDELENAVNQYGELREKIAKNANIATEEEKNKLEELETKINEISKRISDEGLFSSSREKNISNKLFGYDDSAEKNAESEVNKLLKEQESSYKEIFNLKAKIEGLDPNNEAESKQIEALKERLRLTEELYNYNNYWLKTLSEYYNNDDWTNRLSNIASVGEKEIEASRAKLQARLDKQSSSTSSNKNLVRLNELYDKQLATVKEIHELESIDENDRSVEQNQRLTSLNQELLDIYKLINNELDSQYTKTDKIKDVLEAMTKLMNQMQNGGIDSASLSNLTSFNGRETNISAAYEDAQKVNNALNRTNALMGEIGKKNISNFDRVFNNATEEVNKLNQRLASGSINLSTYDKGVQRVISNLNKVVKVLDETADVSDAVEEIEKYLAQLSGGNFQIIDPKTVGDVTTLTAEFKDQNKQLQRVRISYNDYTKAISNLGTAGKKSISSLSKFIDELNSKFRNLGSYLISFVGFYEVWGAIQQGFTYVRELDSALTEMRKVSDETVESLREFQDASFDIAESLGSTAQEIQNTTADWMRLGNSLEDAQKYAIDATTLLKVSEFDNISEATESLVSMSQAWDDIDTRHIIDVMNNIGKLIA